MPTLDRFARRRAVMTGALAALLAPLAACKTLRETFPRREDVFKPIPVSLGEERVTGKDTSYVLAGRGYQVITRDRELLPDAKTALDRTSSAYRRYFVADPPTVGVLLRTPPRKGARPDSLAMPGARVVTMTGWRERDDDPRRGMLPPEVRSGFVALPLARAWLAALADSLAGPLADSLRAPASAPAGTGSPASAGRAAATAAREDPRVPDWVERAVPALVAGEGSVDFVSLQLAQHPDKLLPLRSVVTAPRPAAPADSDQGARGGRGTPRGGGRRGGAPLSGAALYDAQAVSFAEFLAEREGRQFVGQLATALIRGRSFDQAIAGAGTVPHDLDTLDRAWRGWLEVQRADYESRRPGR
ncbi:MAG: hypothetical protein ACJ79S_19505 [Gemmatimonadaceae bacterium]